MHFVVEIETRERFTTDAQIDAVMDTLADFHVTLGDAAGGGSEVMITVPAESIDQAVRIALSLVRGLATVIGVVALPEEVRDAREGWVTVPDLVDVTTAAEMLGVSRQRVHQLIHEGTLQATSPGPRTMVLPRDAVAAYIANRGAKTTTASGRAAGK